MAIYQRLRGTLIIKPEFVNEYFTNTNEYFSDLPDEIEQVIVSYTHFFDNETRAWTFDWFLSDANELVNEILQLEINEINEAIEWIENFVKVEIQVNDEWKEINNIEEFLLILKGV